MIRGCMSNKCYPFVVSAPANSLKGLGRRESRIGAVVVRPVWNARAYVARLFS